MDKRLLSGIIAIIVIAVSALMINSYRHKMLCGRLSDNLNRAYYCYSKTGDLDYETNFYIIHKAGKDLNALKTNEKFSFGIHSAYDDYYGSYEVLFDRLGKDKKYLK